MLEEELEELIPTRDGLTEGKHRIQLTRSRLNNRKVEEAWFQIYKAGTLSIPVARVGIVHDYTYGYCMIAEYDDKPPQQAHDFSRGKNVAQTSTLSQ